METKKRPYGAFFTDFVLLPHGSQGTERLVRVTDPLRDTRSTPTTTTTAVTSTKSLGIQRNQNLLTGPLTRRRFFISPKRNIVHPPIGEMDALFGDESCPCLGVSWVTHRLLVGKDGLITDKDDFVIVLEAIREEIKLEIL